MPNTFSPSKELVEGARREGTLFWHSSWGQANTHLMMTEFVDRFPFLIVAGVPRLQAFPDMEEERRMGQHYIDIIGPTTATTVARYADQGYFAAHESPYTKALPIEYRDPQHRWFATHNVGMAFTYNT